MADAVIAYNRFVSESILVLDVCARQAPLLPGAVWVDASLPLAEAAAAARLCAMEEFTPDNAAVALLLCDSNCARAAWVKDEYLLGKGLCSKVLTVERERFAAEYPFLLGCSMSDMPPYPNEILPGKLFLGSAVCTNSTALADLRITHVLSLLDRRMPSPGNVVHKLCRIADEETANLTPVMHEALPFIDDALARGGRLLVHCDRGASRSASVVAAHLMQRCGLDASAALQKLRECRPCVSPNRGFRKQLADRTWDPSASALPAPAQAGDEGVHIRSDLLPPLQWPLQEPIAPFEVEHGSRKRMVCPDDTPLVTASVPEIKIGSSWGQLLGSSTRVRVRTLQAAAAREYAAEGRLLILEQLFSQTECARLLQAAEAVGFGSTNYPKNYRGNLRLITVDKSLADAAWERLRPVVPQTLSLEGETYDAVGLNECWRLAKYRVGDRFGAHVDAWFEREDGERSLYTVNVYMNAVPPDAGGATRFYTARVAHGQERDPALSIAPEPGLAVVFRQPPLEALLHDGERLHAGVKFLFRTDVMYRRRVA
mmetsp:Transcript_30647/g.79596  ORF Transcript_30647/g.79596 Transcript_30647/m.79596 type:complete len:542 (+) Transcript_30647:49-1674(+)